MNYDFKWQPVSQQQDYEISNRMIIFDGQFPRVLNHFEYHAELSDKSLLFENLVRHCSLNRLDPSTIIPLTLIVELENENFEKQLQLFLQYFQAIN